eukprot:Em0022g582a
MQKKVVGVFAAILAVASAVSPGFQTALTEKAFGYIVQVGIPILEQQLSSLNIPDISGSAGTPIGTVDYDLTSIVLSGLQIPSATLTTSSSGLLLQASGISAHATANWHYRERSWPNIEDSGSADVSIGSVTLSIDVVIGADSQGHATLSAQSCNINIGSLDITFHGGASWLYNLFSGYISDDLKGSLNTQICQAAVSAINTQGNCCTGIPSSYCHVLIIVTIDKTSEINYELLQPPIFTNGYLQTDHKGEFFSIADPVEAPFTPSPIPQPTDTSRMLYIWLTDYIADTAGFVYQQAGILQVVVTPNMVPSFLPYQLNTSYFQDLIPELYAKYPNQLMELYLNATKPPTLDIVPGSANFTIPGEVVVSVFMPDGTLQVAFVLGMVVYTDVSLAVVTRGSNQVVTANVTFLSAAISLDASNIGQFDVSILQDVANLLCTQFIIPVLNKYTAAGLPIPVIDGVSLLNADVEFGQDYAVITTDFNYNPSFKKHRDF